MLFWIFVIIAVLGLIILGLALYPTTKEEEYDRLENEYESAESAERFLPWSVNGDIYKQYREHTRKAYQALKKFEEANPKVKENKRKKETIGNIAGGFAIGASIALAIMILALIITYASAGGKRVQLEAQYEVLSWEVENDVYTDLGDDVVGKKELYNQVREWNTALAKSQYYEKNFWVGIFVPNIYGDLKPIELK